MISSPVGPVLKNGMPMAQETPASPSTAISYENAYPVKPASMDQDRNNKENSPPQHNPATTKPHTSKSSRALHVLSSITNSFSRSSMSLASFKSSRTVSGVSAASSIASTDHQTPKASTSSSSSMRRPLIPRFDSHSPARPEPLPTEPRTITNERDEPTELDPKLIYTAQPSAYWSGRFTALRDRFHNELLEPDTLQLVLEEHMRRSTVEPHLASPDLEIDPHTTPTSLLKPSGGPGQFPKSTPTCARQNATIGVASGTFASSSSRPPLSSGLSRIPFTKSSTAPRRQSYDFPSPSTSFHNQVHPSGTMPPPPAPTVAPSLISATTSSAQHQSRRDLLLLTSDDARRRRAFAALASLCATPAARESLRAWQTGYARRVGKVCLLPAGESLVDDHQSTRGRKMGGWGMGGGGWKRDGSVASGEGGRAASLVGRLRKLSAGRKSQAGGAVEVGRGGGRGGSVVASEPGHVPAWVGSGQMEGERKMRVKRIRRVDHGL